MTQCVLSCRWNLLLLMMWSKINHLHTLLIQISGVDLSIVSCCIIIFTFWISSISIFHALEKVFNILQWIGETMGDIHAYCLKNWPKHTFSSFPSQKIQGWCKIDTLFGGFRAYSRMHCRIKSTSWINPLGGFYPRSSSFDHICFWDMVEEILYSLFFLQERRLCSFFFVLPQILYNIHAYLCSTVMMHCYKDTTVWM